MFVHSIQIPSLLIQLSSKGQSTPTIHVAISLAKGMPRMRIALSIPTLPEDKVCLVNKSRNPFQRQPRHAIRQIQVCLGTQEDLRVIFSLL
mmetsp:Transcript_3012/g.6482  ORF Transcript_3012/g.6482 Transcript_3012/m.6482 type:complete len:91 (-) Transcript_3012:1295-1567(-)